MAATVTLHFLGMTYDLRADGPEQDVAEVVQYVEGIMSEIERDHPGLNPNKLMVLAALHMGRDYIRERNRNRDLSAGMEDTSRRIASKIDEVLSTGDD